MEKVKITTYRTKKLTTLGLPPKNTLGRLLLILPFGAGINKGIPAKTEFSHAFTL